MIDPLQRFTLSIANDPDLFPEEEWIIERNAPRWIYFTYRHKKMPEQGFKLHISATPHSALKILQQIIPILASHKVAFKFCSSIKNLISLLNGDDGITQIGKFITVYPYDSDQAVGLAIELDKATQEFIGPAIPFERSLRENSIVHYRFGSFITNDIQQDNGEVVPAIRTPSGTYIADIRGNPSKMPSWVEDPFLNRGITTWLKKYRPILRDRYLRLEILHKHVKGILWIGIDLDQDDAPIIAIKESNYGYMSDPMGRDSMYYMKKELIYLQRLGDCTFCPKVIDYWEGDRESYLIYQFIDGITLKSYIRNLSLLGKHLSENLIIDWAYQLCSILDQIHEQGLVYRDLKTANIIINKEGRLQLIDYEFVAEIGDRECSGAGSIGYMSPQQKKNLPPSIHDDIYSFGAVLFSMVSMIDPAGLPSHWRIKDHLSFFNGHISRGIQDLILGCLQSNYHKRVCDTNSIKKYLTSCEKRCPQVKYRPRTTRSPNYQQIAINIGELLCNSAEVLKDCCYLKSRTSFDNAIPLRDIYSGNSGIGIFLVELANVSRNHEFLYYAEGIAKWLQYNNGPLRTEVPLPGLFIGEAGVGLFFLRLYQATREEDYLALAKQKSDQISSIEPKYADLMAGAAGIGLFNLILADVTSEKKYFDRANHMAQYLLNSMQIDNSGGLVWRVPNTSSYPYFGFAHGSAGIAYFILEMAEVTKDRTYLECVIKIADWLRTQATDALNDGSGLNWRTREGDDYGLYWCHGATGIDQFFLRAYEVLVNNEYYDSFLRATRTVYKGGKWLGITQCHGLSGSIEFIVDVFQITKDCRILQESIEFVFFSGEEQGQWGTKHYAQYIQENKVDLNWLINLDMVGSPPSNQKRVIIERDMGNKVSNNDGDSQVFGEYMKQMAAKYTDLQAAFGHIYDSDYMPFEALGYVVTGLYDDGQISTTYHSKNDVVSTLNIDYIVSVTKLALATILNRCYKQ